MILPVGRPLVSREKMIRNYHSVVGVNDRGASVRAINTGCHHDVISINTVICAIAPVSVGTLKTRRNSSRIFAMFGIFTNDESTRAADKKIKQLLLSIIITSSSAVHRPCCMSKASLYPTQHVSGFATIKHQTLPRWHLSNNEALDVTLAG